ncbi:MAG: hypothetical protein Q4A78_01915 [Peptostreptococcaceae bacterium]|nr:hypothetical protein [Peptostreptococcaceae bacterium]
MKESSFYNLVAGVIGLLIVALLFFPVRDFLLEKKAEKIKMKHIVLEIDYMNILANVNNRDISYFVESHILPKELRKDELVKYGKKYVPAASFEETFLLEVRDFRGGEFPDEHFFLIDRAGFEQEFQRSKGPFLSLYVLSSIVLPLLGIALFLKKLIFKNDEEDN